MEGKKNMSVGQVDYKAVADRCLNRYVLRVASEVSKSGSGKSIAGWTGGGAATGAIIGSIVPGIGTLFGAGVGALAGLLHSAQNVDDKEKLIGWEGGIDGERAQRAFDIIREGAIEGAKRNGLTELEFEMFISEFLNPRLTDDEFLKKAMSICDGGSREKDFRSEVPAEMEKDIRRFFNERDNNKKGTFTDPRDGRVYKTVEIGGVVWFAENLNFAAEGSVCYGNDPANGDKYGRLYDWETALKACPAGFHLPSDDEWKALVNYAGGQEKAGKKLKSNAGWNNNDNGPDYYGFSALPGGYGNSDGSFHGAGGYGLWWSGKKYGTGAGDRYMIYEKERVDWGCVRESPLFSVRCVAD
jgi:uncharacterized protein (TIGR02145 family)